MVGGEGVDVFSLEMPRLVARGLAGGDHIRLGCFSCFLESLLLQRLGGLGPGVKVKTTWFTSSAFPLGSPSGSKEAVPVSP